MNSSASEENFIPSVSSDSDIEQQTTPSESNQDAQTLLGKSYTKKEKARQNTLKAMNNGGVANHLKLKLAAISSNYDSDTYNLIRAYNTIKTRANNKLNGQAIVPNLNNNDVLDIKALQEAVDRARRLNTIAYFKKEKTNKKGIAKLKNKWKRSDGTEGRIIQASSFFKNLRLNIKLSYLGFRADVLWARYYNHSPFILPRLLNSLLLRPSLGALKLIGDLIYQAILRPAWKLLKMMHPHYIQHSTIDKNLYNTLSKMHKIINITGDEKLTKLKTELENFNANDADERAKEIKSEINKIQTDITVKYILNDINLRKDSKLIGLVDNKLYKKIKHSINNYGLKKGELKKVISGENTLDEVLGKHNLNHTLDKFIKNKFSYAIEHAITERVSAEKVDPEIFELLHTLSFITKGNSKSGIKDKFSRGLRMFIPLKNNYPFAPEVNNEELHKLILELQSDNCREDIKVFIDKTYEIFGKCLEVYSEKNGDDNVAFLAKLMNNIHSVAEKYGQERRIFSLDHIDVTPLSEEDTETFKTAAKALGFNSHFYLNGQKNEVKTSEDILAEEHEEEQDTNIVETANSSLNSVVNMLNTRAKYLNGLVDMNDLISARIRKLWEQAQLKSNSNDQDLTLVNPEISESKKTTLRNNAKESGFGRTIQLIDMLEQRKKQIQAKIDDTNTKHVIDKLKTKLENIKLIEERIKQADKRREHHKKTKNKISRVVNLLSLVVGVGEGAVATFLIYSALTVGIPALFGFPATAIPTAAVLAACSLVFIGGFISNFFLIQKSGTGTLSFFLLDKGYNKDSNGRMRPLGLRIFGYATTLTTMAGAVGLSCLSFGAMTKLLTTIFVSLGVLSISAGVVVGPHSLILAISGVALFTGTLTGVAIAMIFFKGYIGIINGNYIGRLKNRISNRFAFQKNKYGLSKEYATDKQIKKHYAMAIAKFALLDICPLLTIGALSVTGGIVQSVLLQGSMHNFFHNTLQIHAHLSQVVSWTLGPIAGLMGMMIFYFDGVLELFGRLLTHPAETLGMLVGSAGIAAFTPLLLAVAGTFVGVNSLLIQPIVKSLKSTKSGIDTFNRVAIGGKYQDGDYNCDKTHHEDIFEENNRQDQFASAMSDYATAHSVHDFVRKTVLLSTVVLNSTGQGLAGMGKGSYTTISEFFGGINMKLTGFINFIGMGSGSFAGNGDAMMGLGNSQTAKINVSSRGLFKRVDEAARTASNENIATNNMELADEEDIDKDTVQVLKDCDSLLELYSESNKIKVAQ